MIRSPLLKKLLATQHIRSLNQPSFDFSMLESFSRLAGLYEEVSIRTKRENS
jgi:hypothetical protein